jgi:phytoene dehydrogenase-like protein
MTGKKYDVVIIGGGHNGLVAATYLARAGKSVRILEANPEIGGASQSVRTFPQFDANLSRYSYLIALLPDKIVTDLGLSFECISREVSSYTPYGENKGLYVSRIWDVLTESSFNELDPSGKEAKAWQAFYAEIAEFAEKIAPTMLQPLKTRSELKQQIDLDTTWQYLIEEPIGKVITERFHNDVVRGVVLTDALIGTFASAFDIQANICFLYHLIGNGTGEWKVPKGGMGALVNELVRVATESGVEISLNSKAIKVESTSTGVTVELENGETVTGEYLLSNAAPGVLAKLRGTPVPKSLDGSQMKINILLKRLPNSNPGLILALHLLELFMQTRALLSLNQFLQKLKMA